jgi:hypothetical protein
MSQSSRGTIHRVQSLGNARPSNLAFIDPTSAGRKDRRRTTNNKSQQPEVICMECDATVRLKKATQEESGIHGAVPGIKRGDLIVSTHRVGGGMYSARRGDIRCKGSGLPDEEK